VCKQTAKFSGDLATFDSFALCSFLPTFDSVDVDKSVKIKPLNTTTKYVYAILKLRPTRIRDLKMLQFRNSIRAMETETISKNEASLKSQMSRGNFFKNKFIIITFFLFIAATVLGQNQVDRSFDIIIEYLKKEVKPRIENGKRNTFSAAIYYAVAVNKKTERELVLFPVRANQHLQQDILYCLKKEGVENTEDWTVIMMWLARTTKDK